jgi:uncharacterized protein (DUF427 family)
MRVILTGKNTVANDDIVKVEGNNYFPVDPVYKENLKVSDRQLVCPWKGTAYYYLFEVNGRTNKEVARYYPELKEAAKEIKGKVAFRKVAEIVDY